MANKLINEIYQDKIKQATFRQYCSYWSTFSFPEFFEDKLSHYNISNDDFLSIFKNDDFSPIKIYFTQYLINIIYVDELIIENDEDELFDFWQNSEFTSLFLRNNNRLDNITVASLESLNTLIDSYLSYFVLLFFRTRSEHFFIKAIPEIGDFEECLYLENFGSLELENTKFTTDENDFLDITNIHFKESTIESYITLEAKRLTLRPGSKNGIARLNEFEEKLSKSLQILTALTPDLANTLLNFTHTIIALDEPSMVSYSLQSLPGYSSINLFNRDLVDCLDDLIHENGHHFLNYILNSSELIIEDPEKDYFSPWRMELRPIRGIYHGVFTFYWALELFSQILLHSDNNRYFSSDEIEKIKTRYVEEFHKLSFSRNSLKLARKRDLINDNGWDLICSILDIVDTHKDQVAEETLSLTSNNQNQIKKMTLLLKN